MKKKILSLLLTAAMVVSFAACGGSKDAAETSSTSGGGAAASSSEDRETIKIGASYNSLMNDVFTVTQTLMELWAKEPLEADDPFVDLTIVVADGDTTKQVSDVNDLINKGCDVILIDPVDSTAVEPAIAACKQAGVPCITFNRPLNESITTKPDVEIDIAAYAQGYDTAKTTFQAMKDDGIEDITVILCNGETRDDNSVRRANGVKDAADEMGVKVAAELPCDWDPSKVTELLPAALQGNPDTNCVYVATDGMLSGVKSVLESENKWAVRGEENHMYIACCDVFEEGYNMVLDGYVDADTLMDVYAMVKGTFQYAFDLWKGVEVEPLVELQGACYTQENAEDPSMTSEELLWWKWK